MLLCVPPPAEDALPTDEIEAAIGRALAAAQRAGIQGAQVTPFLLGAMKDETGGRSLTTNIALLKNNARVAAEVALALSNYQ